ncbi:hypothetical protein [Phaeodactylibacter xiamenensis]|uniref:hypothetical protein n=1 Tax=Phaeodactylibacter xiamenensis TaxID=1524460 RepID=UPI0024A8B30F|nr:hypothetical protein [Phaeodactylibacter xiamenensis]
MASAPQLASSPPAIGCNNAGGETSNCAVTPDQTLGLFYPYVKNGDGLPCQVSTVDNYDSREDMDKDEGQAWEAVYPGMSEICVSDRIESTRRLVRTEVQELVYSVE